MKNLLVIATILSSIFTMNCNKDKELKIVDANGGLKMRSVPNTNGDKIGLIPNGATVEIIKENGENLSIAGKTGKWTEVKYDNKTGWVFGGFLENIGIKIYTGNYYISLDENGSLGINNNTGILHIKEDIITSYWCEGNWDYKITSSELINNQLIIKYTDKSSTFSDISLMFIDKYIEMKMKSPKQSEDKKSQYKLISSEKLINLLKKYETNYNSGNAVACETFLHQDYFKK